MPMQNLSFKRLIRLLLCMSLGGSISCSDLDTQTGASQSLSRASTTKSQKNCGSPSGDYFEFLDDTYCRKRLPIDRDRTFMCPTNISAEGLAAVNATLPTPYATAADPVVFDDTALKGIVPDDFSVALILVKRIQGIPYYRYLSNGTHHTPVEPWSTTKFLAVINAASSLRYHSDGALGLDANVAGIPLGDLITVIHSYDEERYTSNGLAAWFHDIGGRTFANGIIHDRWLKRPAQEAFGANYGDRAANLPLVFQLDEYKLEVQKDQAWYPKNYLAPFTIAEALKRLVMHREDPMTRLEEITWDDVEVLLYGAAHSIWYGEDTPQGMQSDTAIYLQESVSAERRDQVAQGKWRVFSKLGLGSSRGGEFVYTGYACFPNLTEDGSPKEGEGIELIISSHWGANSAYGARDAAQMDLYRDLMSAIDRGVLR